MCCALNWKNRKSLALASWIVQPECPSYHRRSNERMHNDRKFPNYVQKIFNILDFYFSKYLIQINQTDIFTTYSCSISHIWIGILLQFYLWRCLFHIFMCKFSFLLEFSVHYSVCAKMSNCQSIKTNLLGSRSKIKSIFISYGTVVRDFESEAKTRCNFQFR